MSGQRKMNRNWFKLFQARNIIIYNLFLFDIWTYIREYNATDIWVGLFNCEEVREGTVLKGNDDISYIECLNCVTYSPGVSMFLVRFRKH